MKNQRNSMMIEEITIQNDTTNIEISSTFTNELGNDILVRCRDYIQTQGFINEIDHPKCQPMINIYMQGPNSVGDWDITRLEAKHIHEALGKILKEKQ
jgi:hypothetical protein